MLPSVTYLEELTEVLSTLTIFKAEVSHSLCYRDWCTINKRFIIMFESTSVNVRELTQRSLAI